MSSKSLTTLRKEIDALDTRLLRTLARRFAVSCMIGAAKKKKGIPILDTPREQALIKERVRLGRACGLERKCVEQLMQIVLAVSRRMQKRGINKNI